MKDFKTLENLAKNIPLRNIVVANPVDIATLKALYDANKVFPLKSILVGEKNEIETILKDNNIKLNNYEIIYCNNLDEIAKKAVSLVRNNKADILMKGLIDTKVILKAVVNREEGIRTDKLISHISVFSYKTYHKLLFASDCAMIISPTYEQKIKIIENLLDLTKKLNIDYPKIGVISAVEKVNPNMLSSIEAEQLKEHFKDNEGFIVDGPFALDNVVSEESKEIKDIKSVVAANADGLLFPDIDAGNVFYKTSVYLAGATVAGVVLGAKAPIVLTSRADSYITKYYSILLAGVYSYDK